MTVSAQAVFDFSAAVMAGVGNFVAEHVHEILVGLLVGGIVFALRLLAAYSKSATLIHRVLFDSEPAKFYEVLKRIGWLFAADAASSFQSDEDRFIAARHLVELEIIQPEQKSPHRDDFSAGAENEYQVQRKRWSEEAEKREAGIQAQLIAVLGQPANSQKWWDIDKYPNLFVAWLIRRVYALMRGNLPLAMPSEERQEAFARLANFADLDDNRKRIQRYFNVLSRIDAKIERRFLTQTVLDFGYLSPLFLVTGILNRYDDETGWSFILNGYRSLVETNEPIYSHETKELRAFMFNCWLLWGPSIPQCNCEQWHVCNKDGERVWKEHRRECSRELFQYGYGDENQSMDIIVSDTAGHDFAESIAAMLAGPVNPRPTGLGYAARGVLAVPYEVAGYFRWGPDMNDHEVGPARRSIVDATDGRIVLECPSRDDLHVSKGATANYYSAYIWMIFHITDGANRPFFPPLEDCDNRWKNMLCFFEHGNVADATVMQTLKEHLVAKAASSMNEMFDREWAFSAEQRSEARRGFRVHYACAIDDSNCLQQDDRQPQQVRRNGLRYPPPPIDFHPDFPNDATLRKSPYLIEIFYNAIASRIGDAADAPYRYPALYRAFEGGALVLSALPGHGYTSCDIPNIVEGFYGELETQQEAREGAIERARRPSKLAPEHREAAAEPPPLPA